MFSYYGSKSKIVNYYPPPKHNKIIEPFAGSARYSLKYWENDILLIDKYEVIIKIWKWLQLCSPGDINKLPNVAPGEDIRNYTFDNDESLLLMRFLISGGAFSPNWKVSPQGFGGDVPTKKRKIIENLHKIKHWKIINGDYEQIENEEATWFIDPPYQNGGHKYIESNKKLDFNKLATWCKNRKGQSIVCENTKADWLPFKPMIEMQGTMFKTTEAIWSNHKTNYDYVQQSLYDLF